MASIDGSDARRPAQADTTSALGGSRWGFGWLLALLVVLYAMSLYSYPLFHSSVELFSMVVAVSVFIIAFNTRRLLDNHYLLLVGIGLLFFTILGLPHTFAYKGVQLFPGFDDDLPTQAFIAQRFLLATTFLLGPLFLRRRLQVRWAVAGYALVTGLALVSMLVWRDFPSMFVDGAGLTPLKKILEVVLCAMFVAAAVTLVGQRRWFEPEVSRLLIVALSCFTGSEIAFSLYATPYGLSNLAGHLFQVAAFYFVYRAVLVTALANPFGLLFRELAAREVSLSKANARLSAVAAIDDEAISTLEFDELVVTVLERLVSVMSADSGALLLVEDGMLRAVATVGVPPRELATPIGEGFAGNIAASGKPAHTSEGARGGLATEPEDGGERVRTMLGVPLHSGDAVLGVVQVDWLARRECADDDLQLLEILADRLTLAIGNARLYENERHVASVLQEALLSLPETVPGIRFARAYHSATQTARVGGDFYDVFDLDGDEVGLVIGDVSGKGLPAAALTSLVRNTIKAHAAEMEKSPAEIVRLTSRVIDRASDTSTFVTLFLGVLDRRTGALEYCNAGHTAVIVVRAAGGITQLESNSPVAGAFPDTVFVDGRSTLLPGDTVVMYTDGVIEARREGELYGEQRLFALLAAAPGLEPDAMTRAIIDDVVRFTGGGLSDDVAILVVEWTEIADREPEQPRS